MQQRESPGIPHPAQPWRERLGGFVCRAVEGTLSRRGLRVATSDSPTTSVFLDTAEMNRADAAQLASLAAVSATHLLIVDSWGVGTNDCP